MSLLSIPVLVGALLAVLIGVSLGLLGGGGSILTVPILVYAVGLPAHEAIAMSLLVVGTTSITALLPHARGGRVRWKTGLLFGATSMVGAYLAGMVAHHVPATVLLLAFGAMMLITAVAMMRGGRKSADPAASEHEAPEGRVSDLPIAKIVLEGLAVGAVTGLVGAGGGFLVVPALVLLGKLPMRVAVGTSLLVIAMKSLAAFAGYVETVSIDWGLAAVITVAAIFGSFLGGVVAGRVPQDLLRRGFAWFVVVMSGFVLSQEIPRAAGADVDMSTHWPWVLVATGLPVIVAIADLARRASSAKSPGAGSARELLADAR